MKCIERARLGELFAAIAAREALYVPQKDAFRPWSEGTEPLLSGKPVRSAKDLFFPQVEPLMAFRVTGKQLQALPAPELPEHFVLFGVRACDARSFEVLDRVFLTEPRDTFYASRREAATVITLSCSEPEETCFCTNFGIDPTAPQGDVQCHLSETHLYWQALTEKGEALTESLPLQDCGEEELEAQKARTREILQKLPFANLNLSAFGAGKTKALFDRPEWAQLSESCLGCGTCTFVCPTCQCYDVQEFDNGKTVRRFRCWDSCMYSDFTQMSAGQPRPTQRERFRQRFLHKLVYFPENNDGLFGCVGCGRCLQKCPIHMHIVKVIKTLGGANE